MVGPEVTQWNMSAVKMSKFVNIEKSVLREYPWSVFQSCLTRESREKCSKESRVGFTACALSQFYFFFFRGLSWGAGRFSFRFDVGFVPMLLPFFLLSCLSRSSSS